MRDEQTSQSTRQSRARGLGDQSAFQPAEQTSDPTSNGWLSALLSAWLCFALVGLCVWFWVAYDAFRALPVLDQFACVTALSIFVFAFAATVREYRTDFWERWAARIAGASGVCFLLAFSFRMAITVDRLQHQIASKGVTSARQIAATVGGDSRGNWSESTSPDRVATAVAGTSTTYQIGKQRTVTITEPWRWCSDRSMRGTTERSGREPRHDCCNQCSDDGIGGDSDSGRRFASGEIGGTGSVSAAASGHSRALSDF